jgi:mRNA interferase HigB
MRVISLKAIRDFCAAGDAKAKSPLREWYRLTSGARWKGLGDVRKTFVKTDGVKVASGNTVYVFNIGGNNYRLIAAIHFNTQRVFVLRILTHAQYDKDQWKDTL